MTLATIGYERAELSDFIATLAECGIELLVDIRDRAQSRRPGFSKTALSDALAKAGIEYIHMRELGDPKEGRDAARSGNYDQFRSVFSGVMNSESGQEALAKLETLAMQRSICLMCFERDQFTCHRKIVSDHLETSLNKKAKHLGVKQGLGREAKAGRVRHFDKGATSSVQSIL